MGAIDIVLHFPFEWHDVGVFFLGFFAFPALFLLFAIADW